jgi:osmoprotectant transport system permease protein
MRRLAVLAALVSALLPATSLVTARAVVAAPDGVIRVGSKSFTESYLLAEMVAQVVEQVGEARAERRVGLGGTGLTQRALESGAIDVYPEYTGTITRVILKEPALRTEEEIRARLEPRRLTMSASLGFANTYALAVREEEARRLGLRTIGDLGRHPDLTAAFTSGFIEREDGWPGLRARYGIGLARVEVMEHALAYRAVASGQVDVMDVFSTDGQLERLRLRLLEDERHFFPDYAAVLLARREMTVRYPRTWARLREVLEGRLDAARMARLNAMADLDGRPVSEVAATFLAGREPEPGGGGRGRALLAEIAGLTRDHLLLVLVSVGAAVLLGIPMGVMAAR